MAAKTYCVYAASNEKVCVDAERVEVLENNVTLKFYDENDEVVASFRGYTSFYVQEPEA